MVAGSIAAGLPGLQSQWRRLAHMFAIFASSTVCALVGFAATPSLPATMAVAAFDHGGGPEVLGPRTMPIPHPGAGEVLIRLRAATVGAWEAGTRRQPSPGTKFPVVLGAEGAGTIVALGAGVHDFRLGDEVFGTGDGFYAEYAIALADNIARVPVGLDAKSAAALGISGLSALQGLDEVLQVKAGEHLIIHGATGGVGVLAIQFAKRRGVKVLATVASDEGFALAKRLGADVVVNGKTGNIAAAAKEFAPRGVDAVLGLVGGLSLEACVDTLREDGRGRVAYLYGIEPLPRPRYGPRMSLYSYRAGRDEMLALTRMVAAAHVEVPIAAEYPLAKAADAHVQLEAGGLLGKILLRMGP